MNVKIELEVDDSVIDECYSEVCSEHCECSDCPMEVLPSEISDYNHCKDKYIKTRLARDVRYIAEQLFR